MSQNRRETERDDDERSRPTMKDVSHTAPHETSAGGVWERGPGRANGDDATPTPADD